MPGMFTNLQKDRRGISRIWFAAGYSLQGLRAGWDEPAFRFEAIAAVVMLPASFWLGRNWLEVAALAGSVLLVMIVELLNTAVEAAIDRIGPVDLTFVDNHGTDTSSNPALFATLKPAVAVMANGSTKGGGTETLKILHTFPNLDVWQVHYSVRNGDLNYPANQIANIGAGPNDNAPLHINVLKSGAITVINSRNGYSKAYPKAALNSDIHHG